MYLCNITRADKFGFIEGFLVHKAFSKSMVRVFAVLIPLKKNVGGKNPKKSLCL